MTADWPASLPQAPTVEGNSWELADNLFQPEVQNGPVAPGRISAAAPGRVRWTFLMDQAELAVFDDFYVTTIGFGTLPFRITHPVEQVPRRVIFAPEAGPPVYQPSRRQDKPWRVPLDLLLLNG